MLAEQSYKSIEEVESIDEAFDRLSTDDWKKGEDLSGPSHTFKEGEWWSEDENGNLINITEKKRGENSTDYDKHMKIVNNLREKKFSVVVNDSSEVFAGDEKAKTSYQENIHATVYILRGQEIEIHTFHGNEKELKELLQYSEDSMDDDNNLALAKPPLTTSGLNSTFIPTQKNVTEEKAKAGAWESFWKDLLNGKPKEQEAQEQPKDILELFGFNDNNKNTNIPAVGIESDKNINPIRLFVPQSPTINIQEKTGPVVLTQEPFTTISEHAVSNIYETITKPEVQTIAVEQQQPAILTNREIIPLYIEADEPQPANNSLKLEPITFQSNGPILAVVEPQAAAAKEAKQEMAKYLSSDSGISLTDPVTPIESYQPKGLLEAITQAEPTTVITLDKPAQEAEKDNNSEALEAANQKIEPIPQMGIFKGISLEDSHQGGKDATIINTKLEPSVAEPLEITRLDDPAIMLEPRDKAGESKEEQTIIIRDKSSSPIILKAAAKPRPIKEVQPERFISITHDKVETLKQPEEKTVTLVKAETSIIKQVTKIQKIRPVQAMQEKSLPKPHKSVIGRQTLKTNNEPIINAQAKPPELVRESQALRQQRESSPKTIQRIIKRQPEAQRVVLEKNAPKAILKILENLKTRENPLEISTQNSITAKEAAYVINSRVVEPRRSQTRPATPKVTSINSFERINRQRISQAQQQSIQNDPELVFDNSSGIRLAT